MRFVPCERARWGEVLPGRVALADNARRRGSLIHNITVGRVSCCIIAAAFIVVGELVPCDVSAAASKARSRTRKKSPPIKRSKARTQVRITPAYRTAVAQLRRMQAVVDVGVNFEQYHERVLNLSADISDVRYDSTSPLVQAEIIAAFNAYKDASDLWNNYNDTARLTHSGARAMFTYEVSKEILKRYQIRMPPNYDAFRSENVSFPLNRYLNHLWDHGAYHTAKAAHLMTG